jgi:threonine 3-dehydrogenase
MLKAIVKRQEDSGCQLDMLPVPEPGPGEVLVKVGATAICGTDMHIAQWNDWAQNAGIRLPLVMGHEFSGEVVEVGTGVRNVKVGDYVAGETHIPCGKCYQCRNGLQHICANLVLFGIHINGCFAQYATIPEMCAYKIPSSMPPETGAVLEPLGTSLRAVLALEVSASTVAVIGCGPIGLFAVAAAKAIGASKIVALDVIDERLILAERAGADIVLNPSRNDVLVDILKTTGGVGVDCLVEASGNVQAIGLGLKFLRKGGKVALIGLPSEPLQLNLGSNVIFKEAQIIGIHGREMYRTWTYAVNMLSEGLLNVDAVITHRIPIEEFQQGLNLVKEGKGGKVILMPWST